MNVAAELAWIAELQRRQQAHEDEVARLLRCWPHEAPVTLTYGSAIEVTGVIEEIALGMVQLRIRDDWRRWVPLLQVEAIDGEEVETAQWLEGPKAASSFHR